MRLPEGTFYSKGKEWFFSDIMMKGETVISSDGRNIDWYQSWFNWVEGHDTGECIGRLEEMKNNGASYPMQDSCGRDGCFDKEEFFLVYEKPDLEKLKEYIQRALDL